MAEEKRDRPKSRVKRLPLARHGAVYLVISAPGRLSQEDHELKANPENSKSGEKQRAFS